MRKRKMSDVVKEIYFNGEFVPYNMVAFTDNVEEIKTKIIRWCKVHKKNVDQIIHFKSCGKVYKMK